MLTKEEQAIWLQLMALLLNMGGVIRTSRDSRATVLVCPCIKGSNAEFARICVSLCSDGDFFDVRKGELLVLQNWEQGVSLSIRLGTIGNDEETLETIAEDILTFCS